MPSSSRMPGGTGAANTSWRSGRCVIVMSSVTPAIRLMIPECGPPTFTTTGASIVSPEASVTPATALPSAVRSIDTTSARKRNSAPCWRAAYARFFAHSAGSSMNPHCLL